MKRKFLLSLTLAVFAPAADAADVPKPAAPSLTWQIVGDQKSLGISGIASIDAEHFLAVHDGKKPEHPRLSRISWKGGDKPALTPQAWCDTKEFPADLEAIAAVPGHKHDYLLLASKGKVTRIQLNGEHCKITAQFDLPTAAEDSNMEGLALHCFKKSCLLAWAGRGDDKSAAKISWAPFSKNKFGAVQGPFEFSAPYPASNRRSISDLAIDAQGGVWASAVSDPGDDGPFQSAVYRLGAFGMKKGGFTWMPEAKIEPALQFDGDNLKIEAIAFDRGRLWLGTDDENKGAKIAVKQLP